MAEDPIKHVIVLALENRSFDHMLAGCAKIVAKSPPSGINRYNGKTYIPQIAGMI